MNPRNEMNALQRILAVVGTAGAATLMTLPVLAQTTNNGVLNPNPGIFNEAPYNRSTTSVTPSAVPSVPSTGQTSDRCAPYIQGGVGGPIDNSASQAVSPSQQGIASYSSSSDVAAVPGSTNSYPNQGESYANQRDAIAGIQPRSQAVVGTTASTNLGNSDVSRRQFDANNRSAAVAYRSNGPAGTAGHEVKMNLDAVRETNQSSVPLAGNPTSTSSNLSAAPLPAECAP